MLILSFTWLQFLTAILGAVSAIGFRKIPGLRRVSSIKKKIMH